MLFRLLESGPLRNEAGDGGDGGGGGGQEDAGGGGDAGGSQGAGGAVLFGRGAPGGVQGDQGGQGGQDDGGAPPGFSSYLGDDGGFREGWQNDIGQAHPELAPFTETLSQYKNPIEALKALGNTKALVGRKIEHIESTLSPNREDATQMGLYRQVLGIPETGTVEAYGYRAPEELSGAIDNDQLQSFAAKAHELDLNPKQFEALVNYQAGLMGDASKGVEEAITQADEQAQQAFWADLDKEMGGKEQADKALDKMVRLLRHGGMTDEAIREIGIHRMGKEAVKALAAIAAQTGEDRLPAGGGQRSQAISAEAQYKAIMHDGNNPEHSAYRDPDHTDHARVRSKVQSLIKQANAAKRKG